MSSDPSDKDQTREHEDELKRRNPDERSPEERRQGAGGDGDVTETEEGLLGGVPGALGNKPTG
jgi:hypothetical protein